jgi:tyrosinase
VEAQSNDQTLDWYERAITVMKQRPVTDPTSWRYQAAIHEYNRAGDPLARPSDTLPARAEQRKYWNQCQHGSWYFLPWHRMYLHHFETMVGAAVETLGGPSDWGLPYWNYSDASDPNARLLPTAFRTPTKSDRSVNALYVATRTPASNSGGQFRTSRRRYWDPSASRPS